MKTIELPCVVGDTVFADLREDQRKKPRPEDLTECYISGIEIDAVYPQPLFTAIRKVHSICHINEHDFGRFFASDFGKSVFTKEQYFNL